MQNHGVLIANEAIHCWKNRSQGGLILKIDFEKAYDCVNWGFLLDILAKMGFGEKWCGWIKECVSTVSMSVLINGSPSKEFRIERDDTVLFCNNDLEELSNIKRILRCFQLMSGLRINFSKSSLCGIKIPHQDVVALAQDPDVGSSGRKDGEAIKRVAGEIQLVWGQTHLNQLFASESADLFHVYLQNASVCGEEVGKNPKEFFLGDTIDKRKMHLVKWEVICKKKENGGLGVKNLLIQNLSLLAKWWWRFNSEPDSLWVKVIRGKYNLDHNCWLPRMPTTGKATNLWRDICNIGEVSSCIGSIIQEGFRIQLSSCDSLNWRWSSDNHFSVKSVYNQWESSGQTGSPGLEVLWKNICPPKVEIFAWMAVQSKVATRSVLVGRNMILEGQSSSCPLCSLLMETPQHLFLHCQLSWAVWSQILEWWHVQWVCPDSLDAHLRWWMDSKF
ncbi:uncharacterized protein LOC131302861 [Rhododendron vialii]|uniref:uncharacterized protein LOC131302861 n=1 Tax=Rhododendron vialii TaxID=182163 RepID=UPI00265E2C4B|nr:uncharacterized protein LOC131302861 [Rhododendron vialii]